MRAVVVELVAAAVGVSRQVEPVPSPSLAVMRAGEQAINDLSVSRLGGVLQKLRRLFWRRRQAREIEIDPAQQLAWRGRAIRAETVLFKLAQNENVNFIPYPAAVFHLRQGGADGFDERPELAVFFSNRISRLARGNCFGRHRGLRRESVDPLRDHRGLGLAELVHPHRHRRLFFMCDQTIKPALLRVAGNDGRSARAAFQDRLLTAQVQPRTLDARAVAHHAVPLEDRRYLLFEEVRIRRGRASIMRHKSRADRAERQKPASPVSQAPPLHLFSLCIPKRAESIRPNPSACPPSSIPMESGWRSIICLATMECMGQSLFVFSAISVNANAERQVESPCKQQLSAISWSSRRKDCTALHFPCIINVSRRLLASSSRPPKQW